MISTIRWIFALVLVLHATLGKSQNRLPAFEMNDRLGRGVNMGNMFEAPSETEWGNPWDPTYFKIIADLGFDHVRLPVRWEPAARSMATAPYTINATFLERIKVVVDSALSEDLHIIVNMHHHDLLFEDPTGQRERFLSQWEQIATFFKDYPDNLLFEVLNEPHGNVTPAVWNDLFADALAVIRETNPTRVVLMGVAEFGGLGALSQLELPADEYIIVTPHYYNPFPFTHQGAEWVNGANAWLGTEWLDTEPDRQTVESEFAYALQFSQNNHIPIHVGEFGAYSKADIESRERWTTFLARWFEEKNLSWAYWEFSAGFGIYNPSTKQYLMPLVDALFTNELPEPTPVYPTTVYNSNFSSGQDGWALGLQGGAAGSATASGGRLNITITNGGTQGWHAQLVKNNIALVNGKWYRISFTARAAADRSITFYAGKASDPWNAYSGASAMSISTTDATYTSSFVMTSPTDMAARLVFDLGLNTSGVSIANVKVEELSFDPPVVEPPPVAVESEQLQRMIYPNPATTVLHVEGLHRFQRATWYNTQGQRMYDQAVSPETTSLDVHKLPAGLYVLSLQGRTASSKVKVIKK
jgi:endoglucanase